MVMTDTNVGQQIREHMPVVCSEGGKFGAVDHVDGDYIKLTKNDSQDGQHHWIPTAWVTRVDQHVHVDRPGEQAMREWLSSPPTPTMGGEAATADASQQA